MAVSSSAVDRVALPKSIRFVPLETLDPRPALQLGLLVRKEADPVSGYLLPIRVMPEARVFVGAICDQGDRIIELVEVWVQTVASTIGELGFADSINNAALDARWDRQLKAFQETAPTSFIDVSGLNDRLSATVLDAAKGVLVPVHTVLGGDAWELCREDAILEVAGLPRFTGTTHRYLYQPIDVNKTDFIPLGKNAPRNSYTKELEEALPLPADCVPFNLEAGRLAVRRLATFDLEEFILLLGGGPWRGLDQAKQPCLPEGLASTLQAVDQIREGGHHLFRGTEGRSGWVSEAFYLKVCLWAELFSQVRESVAQLQLPFYGLDAASFRIELPGVSSHLPILWGFRAELVATSEAFALPEITTDTRFFKPYRQSGYSIYKPESLTEAIRSQGSLRLRQVRDVGKGEVVLQGTLATNERLEACASDLVYLRIPLGEETLEVFATISEAEGLAQGEVRFASLAQVVSAPLRDALVACEGVPLPRVPFEVMPVMRTPCDVYALAVMGIRMFLVNGTNTLPVALDECLSLARQVASENSFDTTLEERVARIYAADTRWQSSLGPHRLLVEKLSEEEGAALFPRDLWTRFLSVLIRCFPGVGPDSFHSDFGAASPFALEQAFDPALEDLQRLRIRARSLLLIDWSQNREMGEVLADFLPA